MSMVLGIDTAGPVVGAALWSTNGEQVWSQRIQRGADTVLIPAITALLEDADELSAVAVSVGPGAFTGLRVGVATALGFATSLGLKVVPVSSLAARAALVSAPQVLALLDARKSRVYGQIFDTTGLVPVPLGEPRDASLEDVLPAGPFLAVGEGALLAPDRIVNAGGEIAQDPSQTPALEVARLGSACPELQAEPSAIALAYLRAPDAKTQEERR